MRRSASRFYPPCPRFVGLFRLVLTHWRHNGGLVVRHSVAFVAEIDFDAELAAEGVYVAAQGVDLSVFDLTAFQGTDAVLANVQQASQLGLGESLCLAQFA